MKNWNARDIAETLGIIAVVSSLIFVGIEIRQNSSIARMESYNLFATIMSESTGEMSRSSEQASLLARTFSGAALSDFTGEERIQLLAFYRSSLFAWSALFQSIEEGILDEEYLEIMGVGGLFNSSFFRESWPQLRPNYSSEFALYFEALPWNTDS